jgi:diguanylate cyclase (GGDEF)-like protein/PAS domain S-box-containing protein
MASASQLGQGEIPSGRGNMRPDSVTPHRRRSLSVLFIGCDAGVVDDCLEELKKGQFTVTFDLVLTIPQCAQQLRSQAYDVVLAEYPSPNWKGSQPLELLAQTVQDTPLLFVTTAMASESMLALIAHRAFDHIGRQHIAQLPAVARRALKETSLRAELEEARKALRHSQSLYRALVDNPAYGIGRCDAQGNFVDVNQTLATMLGYATTKDLLAANHPTGLLFDLTKDTPLAGSSRETMRIEPVETEWQRRNGTTLKVKISGRGAYDDQGDLVGHEIIAVDITEQRTLEEQLRHQASSDSLTGLANHRCLFEALHAEICRSKRTEREFSLLLLDLDELKDINDRYGHQAGDQALCRLARVLADCCRSIDTAARQGGDEFALVLPETGAAAATLVAQRICDRLAKDPEEPTLSASVGVACYPTDADTIGTLIYTADRALYAMKDKHPNAARSAHV